MKETEEAEYLGFAAYRLGDYAGAARWLDMAKGSSGIAHWLRAKLQRRAGKLEDAAKSMLLAWEALHEAAKYVNWQAALRETKPGELEFRDSEQWLYGQAGFPGQVAGDLACLELARGEFMQAFDTFRKGYLAGDAAYLAESVLTIEELKAYVDREAPPPDPNRRIFNGAAEDSKADPKLSLRWLLGRRLVRADRYAEAVPYFLDPYDKVLRTYAKALEDGANPKLEKAVRARAWFAAAWIARHDGMEIMGTEFAPDAFVDQGEFEAYPLAQERRDGKYKDVVYSRRPDGELKETTVVKPVTLKPTKEELERLNKFRLVPDVRFHYRIIAAALAMRAAALLPDNSPELADVINSAGLWVKDRDNNTADRYYQELERRCAKTEIGRAARAKRWFVDQTGPWSAREKAAYDAAQPK